MHECMHACMYACMQVCRYACMDLCMYACMHACIHACMHGWTDGRMDGCICVYAHTCARTYMSACPPTCLFTDYLPVNRWMHPCMHACVWTLAMHAMYANSALHAIYALHAVFCCRVLCHAVPRYDASLCCDCATVLLFDCAFVYYAIVPLPYGGESCTYANPHASLRRC